MSWQGSEITVIHVDRFYACTSRAVSSLRSADCHSTNVLIPLGSTDAFNYINEYSAS